jgi:hypothetical protein
MDLSRKMIALGSLCRMSLDHARFNHPDFAELCAA